MEAFDIHRLHTSYAFIDDLSEDLFSLVLAQLTGTLEERCTAISILRSHLLSGKLPDASDMPWPAPDLVETIFGLLEELRLPPLCEQQPELVEELLKSLFTAIRGFQNELDDLSREGLATLIQAEKSRLLAEKMATLEPNQDKEKKLLAKVELSDELLETLRIRALARIRVLAEAKASATESMTSAFIEEWREPVEMWWEVFEVFGQLSSLLGRGWDYARGLIGSQSWLRVKELQKLIEKLPQLRELIATLGRMHITEDDEPPVMETLFANMRRSEEIFREIRTPLAPLETRGVRRSNDLSRILPVEAINFIHPSLRTLFYARLHEHALATYLVEGVMPQRITDEVEVEQEHPQQAESPPKKRGPIIACLDTSGSMAGSPESIAKALVLEALRVAYEEGRPCYVIAFSGPGQTEAQELTLTPEGFTSLFQFLTRSFYGGTDLVAPIRSALSLLEQDPWENADILLVSDGEFPFPEEVIDSLNTAREERGLKLHGVCVGFRNRAMEMLCDEFHLFDEWEALRG